MALALGLGAFDVEVETVGSGAEALEALGREPCDWVVTDVRMPGMTGVELAACVRDRCPRTRLLLLTAYDVSDDERARIAAFGAELLIKPVTAEVVAARCGLRTHLRAQDA